MPLQKASENLSGRTMTFSRTMCFFFLVPEVRSIHYVNKYLPSAQGIRFHKGLWIQSWIEMTPGRRDLAVRLVNRVMKMRTIQGRLGGSVG